MRKVLITLPKQMLEALDRLVAGGHYASRSEAIRDAIRLLFQSAEGGPDEGGGEESMDFLGSMDGPKDFAYS